MDFETAQTFICPMRQQDLHQTLLWASAYSMCGTLQGRGLGRNFLRHLRRTRALLHVVDAAAEDPAGDYWAVREELRMYNPSYCAR